MTTPYEAPYDCRLCPRLVAYRKEIAEVEPDWHNGPVDSFGSDTAKFLVVGMAPGRGGANRTGRPFTGDGAGDLLFKALAKHGFAKGTYDRRADDGLQLLDCMITNVVRCVPPQNKPIALEANNCRPFLLSRIAHLPQLTTLLALGHIAHNSVLTTFGVRKKDYKFGHCASHQINIDGRKLTLINSYHCSRYNTNTGRLTEQMFDQVFEKIKAEF
ncbi:Uracil-DNA glycosylase, family 5 [hydrothermal vent metagenome]|uniref:Type-5 uracil-DNA glycosylase n=1 Tax=hydrothermal vent metagenome TaxID=652676 RepID=A0A3B0SKX8_9ZZZZ